MFSTRKHTTSRNKCNPFLFAHIGVVVFLILKSFLFFFHFCSRIECKIKRIRLHSRGLVDFHIRHWPSKAYVCNACCFCGLFLDANCACMHACIWLKDGHRLSASEMIFGFSLLFYLILFRLPRLFFHCLLRCILVYQFLI